jgi:hypothetical protein
MNKTVPTSTDLSIEGHKSNLSHWLILSMAVVMPLVTLGCKDRPIWSTESRSPDGKMVAIAQKFSNSGFAAPGPDAAFVYLRLTTEPEPGTLILALSEGGLEAQGGDIRLDWLSPTHLEVTYPGQQNIDFQAIKYAGVEISIQQVTGEKQSGRPTLNSAGTK